MALRRGSVKSTLTIFLDEINIRTNKLKGKLVALSRKKTVTFVVKYKIRWVLLPHQGNFFFFHVQKH